MIKSQLVKQFSNPHGPLGRIAGHIMATRGTNVERNTWVARLIDPAPDDDILEIGHGPGLAIEAIWPQLTTGHIYGLELSDLMSETARDRNTRGVDAGKVTFRVGDAQHLPDDLTGFDVIYGVNVSMFWADAAATIAELAARLDPTGRLTLSYMPPPTSDETAETMGVELAGHFTSAGLIDVTTEMLDSDPPAVAITGYRGHR
jgi:SAM-dependent methyltransferase